MSEWSIECVILCLYSCHRFSRLSRREKDIEHFLETSRNKFIGFTLGKWVSASLTFPWVRDLLLMQLISIIIYLNKVSFCDVNNSDTETLVGLPRPIHESVKTLKQVRAFVFNLLNLIKQRTIQYNTQPRRFFSFIYLLHPQYIDYIRCAVDH